VKHDIQLAGNTHAGDRGGACRSRAGVHSGEITVELWHLIVGQVVQLIITVAALKNDSQWLKQQMRDLSEWVVRVEAKADEALKR